MEFFVKQLTKDTTQEKTDWKKNINAITKTPVAREKFINDGELINDSFFE